MRKLFLGLIPALLLIAAGCEGTDNGETATVGKGIASVNGVAITEEEFSAYAERRAGANTSTLEPQMREQLLNELINIELLAQAAKTAKLHEQSPLKEQLAFQHETAMADAAMTQYLESNPVTEEDVRAEYEQRKGELGGTEYKARHILVESQEQAQELITELEGGADFAELAKEHSTEPGADQSGGDLGWFSPAQMVPPFAAAVSAMEPGTRSDAPVQTQFGWHVIKVEDKRAVPPPDFEQVSQQIERFMTNQRIQQYINELRANAEISQDDVAEIPASDAPADEPAEEAEAKEATPEA